MSVPELLSTLAATDGERRFDRAVSVAVLVGSAAATIAGATVWLLLTDPMSVTNAVDSGEISPLAHQLAEVIYSAVARLLEYL